MLEATIRSNERPEADEEITRTRRLAGEPRRDLLARLSALSLADFGCRLEADRHTETEATAVARAWLEIVDSGRAAISWTAAAPVLRTAVTEQEWEAALHAARTPLGRCHRRRLLARFTVDGFSGVPCGPYTVIHFESTFEGRPRAIETVTACLGNDGRWRAAAYFIR